MGTASRRLTFGALMQPVFRVFLTAALCAGLATAALAQGAPVSRPKSKAAQGKEIAPLTQAVTGTQAPAGSVATLYQCENGARLLATFPKKIALITAGEDTYRLKTAPAASGAKYAAGPISFETQKNTAVFDQHGSVTKCKRLP
jgi:membrane-bound inhibitor of C-type lysozyme